MIGAVMQRFFNSMTAPRPGRLYSTLLGREMRLFFRSDEQRFFRVGDNIT